MHPSILIPAFLIGLALTAPQAASADSSALPSAAMDSCGPSFLELNDFLVGDVFQYAIRHSINQSFDDLDGKYTVLAKEPQANGFLYRIAGLTRIISWPDHAAPAYAKTAETWIFTDSARSPLNACKDRLVHMPTLGPGISDYVVGPISGFYTRVRIQNGISQDFNLSNDSTRLKIFGASGEGLPPYNLYRDSAGTSAGYDYCFLVYAAGLGLVRSDYTFFEEVGSFRLSGYIRNGIRHGTVESDDAFGAPVSIRQTPRKDPARSRILRFSGAEDFLLLADGFGAQDLLGRQARTLTDHPLTKVQLGKGRQ